MKNWMFFGCLEAGANNGLFYTLLANSLAQSLEPEAYLIEVLKRLQHGAPLDQAAALNPSRITAEQKLASKRAI